MAKQPAKRTAQAQQPTGRIIPREGNIKTYEPLTTPVAPIILGEGITSIGISSGLFHATIEVLVHNTEPDGTSTSKRVVTGNLRLTMGCANDLKRAIEQVQQFAAATPGRA